MGNYFEGWYFKHQNGVESIAFIPGRTDDGAFIQVITPYESYNVQYPLSGYRKNEHLTVGESSFSTSGIDINITDKNLNINGKIKYSRITPLKYDIMGIFKFLPMECFHGVVSMRHDLSGAIDINGKILNFAQGAGYIESDRGTSFPKSYLWLHNNGAEHSIMVSVAEIPFFGARFTGCIAVIYFGGKEYRFATYLGVRIIKAGGKKLILKQRKLCLEIEIDDNIGQMLYAPHQGSMTRMIRECLSCEARFKFFIGKKMLFDLRGDNTSFECVGYNF